MGCPCTAPCLELLPVKGSTRVQATSQKVSMQCRVPAKPCGAVCTRQHGKVQYAQQMCKACFGLERHVLRTTNSCKGTAMLPTAHIIASGSIISVTLGLTAEASAITTSTQQNAIHPLLRNSEGCSHGEQKSRS